jgi:hypothetical protein
MQREPQPNRTPERAPRRLPARLAQLRRARRRSALGLPEIGALAAAGLLLLAAVCSYLFLLRPQRTGLADATVERETLQRQLVTMRGTLDQNQDTESSAREIMSSLEKFEIDNLGVTGAGSTGVIEELYDHVRANKLRVSGGMSYTQLQEAMPGATPGQRTPGQQGAQQRIVQSVFPGVGVTLTVEGTYPALRRFIRDVEASKHFIVINAVELEGITESGSSALTAPDPVNPADPSANGAPPAAPGPTTTIGRLVSLRVELAAYFRRASVVAP